MKSTVIGVSAIALIVGVACLVPSFLLPTPVYDMLYGWRYPKQWIAGDAVIKDLGPDAASRRYSVDLGNVTEFGEEPRAYGLRDLPRTKLVIGLLVEGSVGNEPLWLSKPVRATVKLVVTDSRGRLVISEEAPLNEWVWSEMGPEPHRSFVYRRGKSVDAAIGDGRARVEEVGTTTDEGWGSYFAPRRNSQYEVTLTTEELSPGEETLSYRLVAYGGGWK